MVGPTRVHFHANCSARRDLTISRHAIGHFLGRLLRIECDGDQFVDTGTVIRIEHHNTAMNLPDMTRRKWRREPDFYG